MVQVFEVSREDPRIEALIARQKAFAEAHTPPGSGPAVEVGQATTAPRPDWLASDGGEPLGCIGLLKLDDARGEIKTMHVLEERRGEGIAQALLASLVAKATEDGVSTLLLETGKSEGFAASRRFYEKSGFDLCEPFGVYREDPFSGCMRRGL